ncbi:hypothetical protein [Sediminibacterium ginsengisoli]|uniref:Activator of Hsp90 ATPase homolog 1-like protein n=1 Tax=Sediminibacterium ginsengisoli TaxID=413434 RepID=A0A1T4LBL2_9BACT|nr:hypothetical protein [Sediminibacterium ginsengisoli]SJZ51928.1 hypothetical protein SAMN04488132_102408 [Sediminibacterium ginsengisoli]
MKPIIPVNDHGKQNDLTFERSFPDEPAAAACFRKIEFLLRTPAEWHRLAGAASAEFLLMNSDGVPQNRAAEKGDLFRIDLPGPGPAAGEGYDWVCVQEMEWRQEPVLFALTLSPCSAPGADDKDTAHFFGSEASSTFVVHLEGNTVSLSYHGRNETPNTDTEKIGDKIRNGITGVFAMAGLSELQWSALLKGLLNESCNDAEAHKDS